MHETSCRFKRSVSRVGQRQTNDATLCQQVRYALPIEQPSISLLPARIDGVSDKAQTLSLNRDDRVQDCRHTDGSSGRSDVGIS